MSKRVLVAIIRGMTDKTPVIVWTHEVPVLQAIHGEVKEISLEDVEDLHGTALVLAGTTQIIDPKDPRFRDMTKERVKLTDLLRRNLGLDAVFAGDVLEEYERMAKYYGMHPDYGMPFVEYVYGRPDQGRFKDAIGEIPEVDEFDEADYPGANPVKLETKQMTDDDIRASLREMNVEFPAAAKGATLRRIYEAAREGVAA